jgi:hypothetical protein
MVTERNLKYEILSGSKATIESTLKDYESSKDAHSLRVLAMTSTDGLTFQVLVRFVEITIT